MKLTYIPLMLCISLLIFNSCDKDSIDKDPQTVYDQVEISYKEKAEDAHTDCFDMVYPVSYTMPDQSTITLNNEEEASAHVKSWYNTHEDSDIMPLMNLPITIILHEDERKFIVSSKEEWTRIKNTCNNNGSVIN